VTKFIFLLLTLIELFVKIIKGLKILTFTFHFRVNITQGRQKTQFDKDFRFLASKTQKLSKKDNHLTLRIKFSKF
jgi:hypothetical protein